MYLKDTTEYTRIRFGRQCTEKEPGVEGQVYAKLLVQLCDLVAPLVYIFTHNYDKIHLSGHISDINYFFSTEESQ